LFGGPGIVNGNRNCSAYEKSLNCNLIAQIKAHLYRQLFDSLFRIAAELSRIACTTYH
jgi:hypothetical protein